jgi:hypothetical protein
MSQPHPRRRQGSVSTRRERRGKLAEPALWAGSVGTRALFSFEESLAVPLPRDVQRRGRYAARR